MGFFTRKHKIPDECIYDPYYDLESEIVGEVQRIMKDDNVDADLIDYENFLTKNEEERKHLLKLSEIFNAMTESEVVCMLVIARTNFPDAWHKVNARVDSEMRELLDNYTQIANTNMNMNKGVKDSE